MLRISFALVALLIGSAAMNGLAVAGECGGAMGTSGSSASSCGTGGTQTDGDKPNG